MDKSSRQPDPRGEGNSLWQRTATPGLMDSQSMQELLGLLRSSEDQALTLTEIVRVVAQMSEFGLDHRDPETLARAVEIIKQRADARQTAAVEREGKRRDFDAAAAALAKTPAHFVYYVDLYGDAIKIGFSRNVPHRLIQLRRKPQHLLAVEPGGREVERLRHQQFNAERRRGTEDFDRSAALLTHIDELVRSHGEPAQALLGSTAA